MSGAVVAEILAAGQLSRGEWALRITEDWRQTLEGVLRTGRDLMAAKEGPKKLPHGEFTLMVEDDLPFGERTAQKLMAIARDQRLTNPTHESVLPPPWMTLYELTRLGDEQFADGIKTLAINPEMKRSDVTRLRQGGWEPSPQPDYETCTVADLQALIDSDFKAGAILADCPWSFKVYSGKGKRRSAERHYRTITQDDICAGRFDAEDLDKTIDVSQLAANDCALFLWAVMPQLPEALEVIKAWGFEYKTCGFTWVKTNSGNGGVATGMGYWTRSNAELCLLATRGSPKRLAKDVQQIIMADRGEHSAKPFEAHKRIERLVVGPYLEMFGRRITEGWTVWGNEIERTMFEQSVPEIAA